MLPLMLSLRACSVRRAFTRARPPLAGPASLAGPAPLAGLLAFVLLAGCATLTEPPIYHDQALRDDEVIYAGDPARGTPIEVDDDFRHHLVIVFDGLRSDYIEPDLMPNLSRLAERGVVNENHHVVYPTVTRLNAASLAAGAYPGTHGIVHNHLYLPQVDDDFMSAGGARTLQRIQEHGPLLTSPTLGEQLQAYGRQYFVTGSASTGTNYLLNHTGAGAGVWNARGFVMPEDKRSAAIEAVRPFSGRWGYPNVAQNRWATDAYLGVGLDDYLPDVAVIWYNDPDYTAHRFGPGAPETDLALRHVDAELGRILDGLESRQLLEQTNIIVTSDHGFSQREGGFRVNEIIAEHEGGITRSGNFARQIYVEDEEEIEPIARTLLGDESVGAVFTRPPAAPDAADSSDPADPTGRVPGTLSMDLIHYNHERAPDILASAAWSHRENEHGYPGYNRQHVSSSIAGHGTASPYELQVTAVAAGPDFKRSTTNPVPTGNVDIAPTLLHLAGASVPEEMDGRVMSEILRGGPDPASIQHSIRRYESTPLGHVDAAEASEDAAAATDEAASPTGDAPAGPRTVLYRAHVGDHAYMRKALIER